MTSDSARTPGGWRLHQLWLPLIGTGVVLVAATVVAALWRGFDAAAGVFAGVGVVAVSYSLTMVVVAWADATKTSWVLPLGMLTYVVKFTVIGVVLASVAATGWAGMPAMGFGVIIGLLTWIPAQIVALNRYNRRVEREQTEAGMTSTTKQE